MKTKLTQLALTAFLLSTLNSQLSSVLAQGTAITYQGRLTDLSSTATGSYDFTFQLFDAATGGASQGGPLSTNGVSVTDGFFTVTLDFGAGPFSGGGSRWLQIGVRTNAGGAFDLLATRQALTATPYAITAGTVTGPVASSSLSGNYSNAVNFGNGANSFSGSFAGDGAGLTNLNPALLNGLVNSNSWQLGGNHGTNSSWYLGTADYQPLELRVNGGRGLRLQPASNNWPNLVVGASNNVIFGDVTAASIGGGVNNSIRNTSGSAAIGGGRDNLLQLNSAGSFIGGGQWNLMGDGSVRSVIGGGYSNQIRGFTSTKAAGIARDITDGTSNTLLLGETPPGNATISGGYLNTIGVDCPGAVIGGGEQNLIADGSVRSVVGGGTGNQIQSNAGRSTIGGGDGNQIQSGSIAATVGGGSRNQVQSDSISSTVGGGQNNLIQPFASRATIAGGSGNVIQVGAIEATIGGGGQNQIQSSAFDATISGGSGNNILGGAQYSTISGGRENQIQASTGFSTIGGGLLNSISSNLDGATIGGGINNTVQTGATAATIGGGTNNTIQSSASSATIAGGFQNTIGTNNDYATIAGGFRNTIQDFTNAGSASIYAAIGGGNQNTIQRDAFESVIGGGKQNVIEMGAFRSTIGGGANNDIAPGSSGATIAGGLQNTNSGAAAMIPGGQLNRAAGDSSFAAGYRAKADHLGAFVWADFTGQDFASTGPGQFLIRASGGVGINTPRPVAELHVNGNMVIQGPAVVPGSTSSSNLLNLMIGGGSSPVATNGSLNGISFYESSAAAAMSLGYDGSGGASANALRIYNSAGNPLFTFEASGELGIGTNSPQQKLHVIGNILASGTITGSSDRNVKERFTPVNPCEVLEKVTSLPITQWSYKADAGVRHLGPMAQDFYAAFAVGMDDKHISMVDADGVALAAIQGLNQKLEAELKTKDARITELEKRLSAIESLLQK